MEGPGRVQLHRYLSRKRERQPHSRLHSFPGIFPAGFEFILKSFVVRERSRDPPG
jgi:hypothetical protein